MINPGTVSVIIPAFNEGSRIGATLDAVQALGIADEVIVVDDGSADNTARAAAAKGARIIRLPKNLGKGAALNEGLAASLGSILFFLDADLGESVSQVLPILNAVKSGEADIAVGAFSHRSAGGVGLVTMFARWGIRFTCGMKSVVPISGQRAMRREVLEAIYPLRTDFGAETAMTIDAVRAGLRLKEVPVDISHPPAGISLKTFIHSLNRNIGISRAVFYAIFKYKRPSLPGKWKKSKRKTAADESGFNGLPSGNSPGDIPPF